MGANPYLCFHDVLGRLHAIPSSHVSIVVEEKKVCILLGEDTNRYKVSLPFSEQARLERLVLELASLLGDGLSVYVQRDGGIVVLEGHVRRGSVNV